MLRRSLFAVIGLVMFSLGHVSGNEAEADPSQEEFFWLCRALETIKPGDQQPIIVSGVLSHGYLYSPDEPVCSVSVQPTTCVEFPTSVGVDQKLEQLLKVDRRAFVRIRGALYGPLPEGESAQREPPAVRVTTKRQNRYCRQGLFRTKLVVEELLEVGAVPDSVPWNAVIGKPKSTRCDLTVIQSVMPNYPPLAVSLGVSGTVTVAVTVHAGSVSSAVPVTGDPALIEGTLANIRSWKFGENVNCEFSTFFIYKLESRFSGSDKGPVVEARLPWMVRVTGARDD